MKCPDCGRRNVIPPPTIAAAPKVPAAMSGAQYGVWDVDVAPGELAARTPLLHPVECGLCQTLMYATDAQVGKKLKCPDCGTGTLATARAAVKVRGPVIVPDGEEYQLDEASAPIPRPAYLPVELRGMSWKRGEGVGVEGGAGDGGAGDGGAVARSGEIGLTEVRAKSRAAAEGGNRARGRATAEADSPGRLPRLPLVQGVWAMLFTSEVLVRWVGLCISLTGVGWFLSWILNAMGSQVFLALPMFAAGCVLAGFWLLTALPVALAVVAESSDGNDRLHDPPTFISFDFAEAFFVAVAAAVSAIPAWLTFKATATLPEEAQAAIAAGAWLACFPIVLLSNLEQSSAFAVFSPRLGSSVFRCAGPWVLFYFESTVLAAAVGSAAWGMALSGKPGWWLVLPWLAVAALFIYMRLLGRLAWWIAELTPAVEEGKTE